MNVRPASANLVRAMPAGFVLVAVTGALMQGGYLGAGRAAVTAVTSQGDG